MFARVLCPPPPTAACFFDEARRFVCSREATYRGLVSIPLLFVILFPFEILLFFYFPSISVFAQANSTIILPLNSSIRNDDKLSSFRLYSLCMHQVVKPLTIPMFLHSFTSSDRFVVIVRTLCDLHSSSH